MLVRISVKLLRLGMYIHEFCGSWYDHPFWSNAFLLNDPEDLRDILSTSIKEVWIDTAKGLGVEAGGKAEELVASEVDHALAQVNTDSNIEHPADLAEEAVRAFKICASSKEAVSSMFQEARMGKALDAADALPIVEEISNSVMRNPGVLISLARLKDKDNYTYMHSVAVCALMVSLARQLGLNNEQTRQAGLAGMMHDIGKTMTPQEIINKSGKLTTEEFRTIKNHPAEGHKILRGSKGISDIVLHVCLHHHERVDGRGYPENLTNEKIDLYSKMCAVCDVYDAITSIRAYKNGWEPAQAIRKMAEWSRGHFDQRIFEAFVRSVGIYPIGSMVRLASDRLGVVVAQTDQSLLTPRVKVFFSIESDKRIPPEILDLSKPSCQDKIVSHEDPVKWKVDDLQELWCDISAVPW